MIKERWRGSVTMANETVKRKFWYGGSAHGLAWCMYSTPVYKGKGDKYQSSNSRGIKFVECS